MITFEKFKKHIEEIKTFNEFENMIMQLCCEFNHKTGHCAEFELPSLEESIIELLEDACNDETDMIGYWIYELNFGEDYTPGCVQEDDEDIDISTIEKLYKYLEDRYKEPNKEKKSTHYCVDMNDFMSNISSYIVSNEKMEHLTCCTNGDNELFKDGFNHGLTWATLMMNDCKVYEVDE